MDIMDGYLASLSDADRTLLQPMYDEVRRIEPSVTEAIKYGMPTFLYNGKGLIAIIANKKFASIYPYCNLVSLGLAIKDYETTTGSIHFTAAQPISPDLLCTIVTARRRAIDRTAS